MLNKKHYLEKKLRKAHRRLERWDKHSKFHKDYGKTREAIEQMIGFINSQMESYKDKK